MNPNADGTGLVAAPSDQSTGVQWGCFGTIIIGADGTAIAQEIKIRSISKLDVQQSELPPIYVPI